ncbi:MAG: hypothetical protein LAO76_04335 [Acidobacteriia bacterium]|nr:hypothetical protein [Terriglobia bacterium]
MNSRYFQNNIHSHSFNKSSNALSVIPNGGDHRATYDDKNSAENPNGIVRAPQLLRAVPVHSGVLNSWKEIATYLGRGVRTVQRWEAELQLPVHRPRGKNRSAVIAFREELDQWLSRTPLACDNKQRSDALRAIAHEMQELALQLFAGAESQIRPESGKLVEAAHTILYRLDLWMNCNSALSGFDRSSPGPRT